jgi:transposase InsO family protein
VWLPAQGNSERQRDNGTEYLNQRFKNFLHDKGVEHQTSAPYTPEQNNAAERLNWTIMERVRAMLVNSQLPRQLWAEAAVTANYLRNRAPTTAAPTKTPWELLYGTKPDVAHLQLNPHVQYAVSKR